MKGHARVFRFVLIGGFAATVNLLTRIAVDRFTSYEVAIVLAFLVGLTVAFALSKAFVFDSGTGNWKRQYWRFSLVNLATLLQILLVSALFAHVIFPAIGFDWNARVIAHAIGLVSPIPTSYWAHTHFSFAAVDASKPLPPKR